MYLLMNDNQEMASKAVNWWQWKNWIDTFNVKLEQREDDKGKKLLKNIIKKFQASGFYRRK